MFSSPHDCSCLSRFTTKQRVVLWMNESVVCVCVSYTYFLLFSKLDATAAIDIFFSTALIQQIDWSAVNLMFWLEGDI